MRSYGQYCALARALDVVGDRWTLLIVRELAVKGPSRYTDLRHGLPGIATNMLADRLREMEENGIVQREEAPPPVASTLFELTDRGRDLLPVLFALGRWGVPLMEERGDDEWRGYWLKYPLEELFADVSPDQPPVSLELHTDDGPVTVRTVDGRVKVNPGAAEHPDAVVTGNPDDVIDLLKGAIDIRAARRRGVRVEGDAEAIARVRPRV